MASRDVFYVNGEGAPGPFQLGADTFTNLGANWGVSLQPALDVGAETGSGWRVELEVVAPIYPALSPGTYVIASGTSGASVSFTLGDELCNPTAGNFTLTRLDVSQTDDAGAQVASLLMSFEFVCGADTFRGCVRYSP